jgi:hypothetical protein
VRTEQEHSKKVLYIKQKESFEYDSTYTLDFPASRTRGKNSIVYKLPNLKHSFTEAETK